MTTLLLLPGMDGSGTLFADFVAALGDACHALVGHYPSQSALGYDELLAVARSFVPADGPYWLVGESFSGPIAVALAAEAGPRLQGLILCASFVKNPLPIFSPLVPMLGFTPMLPLPPAVLSPLLLGTFSNRTLRAQLGQALASLAPDALRARLRAVLTVDVSTLLGKITVPILYLQAKQDRLVPASAGRLIRHLRPDAVFRELDGPHLLLQTQPQAASRVVLDFMAQADGLG